jgi:hypothetical protein
MPPDFTMASDPFRNKAHGLDQSAAELRNKSGEPANWTPRE